MSELIKTTVYLSRLEYRALKALARRQGRPAAELVREAVGEYTSRELPSRQLPRSLGIGRSGRGDVAERAEELLVGMGSDRR
jgi:hypothetical protein